MDFIDQLQQFVEKVSSFQNSITTEEATKTSVILPFFRILGYDVFDPTEFVPEFVADVGIKKGEKVDYAILQDGNPIIIIEAKSLGRSLEKHDSQLFRYFSTTSAKFAILTNGIRYRFYTDLEETNLMDHLPFLDIDLLHLRDSQIEQLQKFRKCNFNASKIFDSASVLKYTDKFKEALRQQFENPSDAFVRLFLQDLYDGRMTHTVIEKFRPILHTCMQEFIIESVQPQADCPSACTIASSTDEISPTNEELNAYYELQNLLRKDVDLDMITYKKTESYFAVIYQNNSRKWLCRMDFSGAQKNLLLPSSSKNPIHRQIANIYELASYRRYLTSMIVQYGGELLHPLEMENPPVYQIILERRIPRLKK